MEAGAGSAPWECRDEGGGAGWKPLESVMRGSRSLGLVAIVWVGSASVALAQRTIDGSGNNPLDPEMGSAQSPLARRTTPGYADGVSIPSRPGAPSAREVSNAVAAQAGPVPAARAVTDFVWQWGQFLDHDLDLTEGAEPSEPFDVPVPMGDPFFDPFGTGTQVIPLNRSVYDPLCVPRQQLNQITTWIDASNVYGSDPVRALALRRNDGSGMLRTSAGDLLPFNTSGLPNAGGPDPSLFLAGDVRANEQIGLTALHTLFVREHNRIAEEYGRRFPASSDETRYQMARLLVGAEMQAITYREFLPVVLGPDPLPPYVDYDPTVDARIANVFSTAAYRFGHTMLSPVLQRLDAGGAPIPEGPIELKDAFFNPSAILDEGGIEPILRGLAEQRPQEVDNLVVDAVRNFLFGPPGSGGFDLASLNIQRGRDHGLPSYNQVRVDFGLAPRATIDEITSDAAARARLRDAYGPNATPDDVDVWVGGLTEDHVPGALVGETFHAILRDQFLRLRDGDRFWYERAPVTRAWGERTTLAEVIRRNTDIGDELQDRVFRQRMDDAPWRRAHAQDAP